MKSSFVLRILEEPKILLVGQEDGSASISTVVFIKGS